MLIAGGYGEGSVTLAAAELFDPVANTFTPTGSLGAARADHVAIPLENGKVLIAGGLGPGWTFLASAEIYDPVAGRFSPTGSMTTARESHAAVRLPDGRVLVVGGHNGQRRSLTLLASAEIYDPATGAFRRAGAMRIARHKHDAVLLPSGQVLITGGADDRDDRGVYDSTELFDPQTGRSVAGPVMKLGRYKHAGTSVLLPSGLVLIAGGAPQADVRHREPRFRARTRRAANGGAVLRGRTAERWRRADHGWVRQPHRAAVVGVAVPPLRVEGREAPNDRLQRPVRRAASCERW